MHNQAFHAELPIKRLDKGNVYRFVRAGVDEDDAAQVDPEIEVLRDELGSLVDREGLSINMPL